MDEAIKKLYEIIEDIKDLPCNKNVTVRLYDIINLILNEIHN